MGARDHRYQGYPSLFVLVMVLTGMAVRKHTATIQHGYYRNGVTWVLLTTHICEKGSFVIYTYLFRVQGWKK